MVTDFCGRLVHSPQTSLQEVDVKNSNVIFPKGKRHNTICFLCIYFTAKILLKCCADIILKFWVINHNGTYDFNLKICILLILIYFLSLSPLLSLYGKQTFSKSSNTQIKHYFLFEGYHSFGLSFSPI